jgi:hypothetical protein
LDNRRRFLRCYAFVLVVPFPVRDAHDASPISLV